MKVLLCSPFDDGNPIHTGGIALWAKNLKSYYESLNDKNGLELDILSCNRSYYINLSDSLFSRLKGGVRDYLSKVRELRALLKKQHYEVVHVCTSASLGLLRDLLFLRAIRKNHSRSVIHFRFGRIPELSKKRNWEWMLLKMVVSKADRVIVIDSQSLHTLENKGFDNVVYLPNPLQEKTLELIEKNKGMERQTGSILFVGHVIPSKGTQELVQAVKSCEGLRLLFAGLVEEEDRDSLVNLAGKGSENWLSFLGHVGYEETIRQMLSCDVFVLPSYTEGFPNVILEAMACGCAIIATTVGAIPEMLEEEEGGHYGLLVKPKDVEELKFALRKITDDVILKNECSKNARKRVSEKYSMDRIWNDMVNEWRNVMK